MDIEPWWVEEDDFHTFRGKGLGSSDMAVILGISPYKTRYQLWLEKTGQVKPDNTGDYATSRGTRLEHMVRDWYDMIHNTDMVPERRIHPKYPYLRANADGVDSSMRMMIEIKCGDLENHESGKVPEKYWPQVQFLNYVFGYPIDYVSYNENSKERFKVIHVEIDKEFTKNMIKEAHDFWHLVQNRISPELSPEDEIEIIDDDLKDLLEIYEDTKDEYDAINSELKVLKQHIATYVDTHKAFCGDYNLRWSKNKSFRITRRKSEG